MILSPVLRQRYFDSNGNPLALGKLYSYVATTLTPQDTYSNQGGTTNTNPVVMDADGYCDLWLDPTLAYKFVLKDADDNTIWTRDNVSSAGLVGAPTWNSTSSYDEGSIVADSSGAGLFYVSLSDNNVGNALTNVTYWRMFDGAVRTITATGSATVADNVILSNSTAGAVIVTLPACATTPIGKRITIKDIGTGGYTTSVRGAGSDQVDGNVTYATALKLNDSLTVVNNGTTWKALDASPADNSTIEKSSGVLRLKDAGITQAKLAARATGTSVAAGGVAISASSGAFTTTSGTFVDVTNNLITIIAAGRPVKVFVVPDGSSNASYFNPQFSTTAGLQILRDATVVAVVSLANSGSGGTAYGVGAIQVLDVVTAGTYVYKLQAKTNSGTFAINYVKLVAYEI